MQLNSKLFKSYRQAQKAFDDMFKAPTEASKEIKQLSNQIDNVESLLNKSRGSSLIKRRAKRKIKDEAKELQRQERQEALREQRERERRLLASQRQRERLEAKKEKERNRILQESRKAQRLPTREINLEACIPIQLDNKTTIFVKPGTDIELVKERFRNRNKLGNG